MFCLKIINSEAQIKKITKVTVLDRYKTATRGHTAEKWGNYSEDNCNGIGNEKNSIGSQNYSK
jgi:hypothetical protein